jgi:Rhs element Vgr protein
VTAPSPEQAAGATGTYTITANGTPLPTSVQVLSIDIWQGVNKLPQVRLVISDGSAADEDFPLSAGSTLIPGATLEVALGYDSNNTTIFTGIIYAQGLDITQDGASRLIVDATDKATVMTLARRNAIYENLTDSDLAVKLVSNAGLSCTADSTSITYPAIVQYYSTDWDLLLIRAQLNSLVVLVDAGQVTVTAPDTSTDPVLTLTFGDSILDFRAGMDATTQFTASAVQSFAWDPATQALATSGTASASVTTPGNLSSDTLAAVFNVSQYLQQSAGSLTQPELTAWSSAELLKARLAKIRGEVTFQGSALAVPGCTIALAGLGDRFNGNGYVAGVHHRLVDGLWRTSAEIGLSPYWFAATAPYVAAPGAAGQLPPAPSMQTGTVLAIDSDPGNDFRVQVSLPLLQAAGGAGVWARLGSFYASNGVGAEFYPEIGDEVMVAFMNGDPRFAVIVGSLYSSKNPPPVPPAAGNNQKTLLTRGKLRIDFFEDKPSVMISTPANQSVTLDDAASSVTIKDANGNSITMDASGITIKSGADIKLDATGNISLTAQASFAASGQAGAKLTSTAIVQVKGTMVELNP